MAENAVSIFTLLIIIKKDQISWEQDYLLSMRL